jgi:hypothetical protein
MFIQPIIISNSESYYLFLSVIVVTHWFISEYLRKIRLCLSSLSLSLSKVIIINCKIRQKNQPLCLIIAFDLRHIYVQISCTEHTIPLIIGLSIKMSWEVCMITHWFFSLNCIFFSQLSKWNDVSRKKKKTTTVHFVIMVMATAVYSTWIFN